jgi:hypothetical protein
VISDSPVVAGAVGIITRARYLALEVFELVFEYLGLASVGAILILPVCSLIATSATSSRFGMYKTPLSRWIV